VRPRQVWGAREKKIPKKETEHGLKKLKKNKKKGEPEFATLVSPGTGRDEKGSPISAPSIHTHGCSGGCWFNLAPTQGRPGQYERVFSL